MGTVYTDRSLGLPPHALMGCRVSMLRWPAVTLPEQAPRHREESAAEVRRQALEQLYGATAELIYRFIYCKVGNREDAEDLTSQVYIKAALSLDLSQDARTRLAWLYQVARTTLTDHWRSYYKHAANLEHLEDADLVRIPAEPLSLGDTSEEDWTRAAQIVEAIFCRLPEKYRRVLQLRFFRGYSAREIAVAMGLTEGGVRVIQHRALHKAMKIGAQLNGG